MKTIAADSKQYWRIRDSWITQHAQGSFNFSLSREFNKSLAEYSARIETTRDPAVLYGTDVLGLAPNHDCLVFDSDYAYTLFCIRYSA